jgi:flagellar biogenesis protein FliO
MSWTSHQAPSDGNFASLGSPLLTMILSIFWLVKNITKVSHMKVHKQTMNDFGSNNLVPHVHVLYLNVGTKWTKNQAWGPNLTCWPTPQV